MCEIIDFHKNSKCSEIIGQTLHIIIDQVKIHQFLTFLQESDNFDNIEFVLDELKNDTYRIFFKPISKLMNTSNHSKFNIDDFFSEVVPMLKNLKPEAKTMIFLNTNFLYNLAYYNINIKLYFEEMNRYLRESYSFLSFVAPHCENRITSGKIKIGVICQQVNMRNISSVFKDRSEIIKRLNPDVFEKYLVVSSRPNLETQNYKNKKLFQDFHKSFQSIVVVDMANLNQSIKTLADLKLDIVLYPAIGMDILTTIFSHFRFAPIQINTWGNSVTSGNPVIDYFISSAYYEVDDFAEAQAHYSETLILSRSLCTYYLPRDCDTIDRSKLKLPLKKDILFCMQVPQKINTEFLHVVGRIITRLDNTVALFLKPRSLKNQHLIKKILKEQVILLEMSSWDVFSNYVKQCDLVLDSYPTGGCNTSLDAFLFNKIVVTCPTRYLRGRFTQGFYKKMFINYPIAKDLAEYENKAVEFMNNKILKRKIENEISRNKCALFKDQASVDEWNDILSKLVQN